MPVRVGPLSVSLTEDQAGRTVTSGDEPVVVIGSGPAGAAAALALIQRRIPVTMLETGERMPSGWLIRAGGRTVFRHEPPISRQLELVSGPGSAWLSALEPGGLSNHWTGAVPRFSPLDFADGARSHERFRWPLSYQELAPYYDRVERVLRLAGPAVPVCGMPQQQVEYRVRLPRDWDRAVAAAARFGQGLCPTPIAGGARWAVIRGATTFSSFSIVRRLLDNPNFTLRLGAHALQIVWDSRLRRASGVIYHDRLSGATRKVSAGAVIVAAGSLASTKLLFDSACGDFPDGLANTEGLLGAYLHDHYHDMFVIELDRPMSLIGHPALLTRIPHSESPPMSGVQLSIGGRSRYERLMALAPLRGRRFGVIAFGSTTPSATNTARPDRTQKDAFSLPLLRLHLKFTSDDLRNAQRARDRLIEILDAGGIDARITWSLETHRPGSSVHYGGTVRMHENPAFGMTDAYCRLHAVKNVALPDASCFTTSVEKNPALTVMALAMRAGDRIVDDLRFAR